jgi:agmatinase
MIDPMSRWRDKHGKPDYAGLLTFAALPYTEDPAELAGFDVAIVEAPMDELVSERGGTRFGPRAIRAASAGPGPHLAVWVDPFEVLRVVDYGDAAVVPADPVASHAAIRDTVAEVLAAGVFSLVLGGDHSISEPEIRACAATHGPVGLIHFDTHTDTGAEAFGVELSHGTPFYKLVNDGLVDGSRYVQIGLRGYWPGEDTFAWQREHGISSFFMHDVTARGIAGVVADALAVVGDGPTFLTVDVDALDPAFAPGTGTPEPGGMTSVDLLWACREVASHATLVGADVVEVAPTEIGAADITALVGSRLAHEILTGLALARCERR